MTPKRNTTTSPGVTGAKNDTAAATHTMSGTSTTEMAVVGTRVDAGTTMMTPTTTAGTASETAIARNRLVR